MTLSTIDRDALYARLLIDAQTAAVHINEAKIAGRVKHSIPMAPVLVNACLNFTGKIAMVDTYVVDAAWRYSRNANGGYTQTRGLAYRKIMRRRIPIPAMESRTAVVDYIFSVASARQLDAMWAAVARGV